MSHRMVTVPAKFRPIANYVHPPYCNKEMIEQYFFNHFSGYHGDRVYLPIFWTNYYVMNGYEKGDHSELHKYLDSLDKNKKYFTVVQYDDGVLWKPADLDLLTFAAGGIGDIPIPLLPSHMPFPYTNGCKVEKSIGVSFIGGITHPIRSKLMKIPGVTYGNGMNPQMYLDTIAKSAFTLAPRGYGKTSFRLYEALALKSVPVYVSDEFWLPYKKEIQWEKFTIGIKEDEIHLMTDAIKSFTPDWEYYESIKHYFTMEGITKYIKQCLASA
jgi:hypothetical protein